MEAAMEADANTIISRYIKELAEVNNKILDHYINETNGRMDRHSLEQRDGFSRVMLKLDAVEKQQVGDKQELLKEISEHRREIDERIHGLEIKSLKSDFSLGLKIASLTGNIGTIIVILKLLKLLPGSEAP